MADKIPMQPQKPGSTDDASESPVRTLPCEEWEALLADALDGTLPAAETAAFEAHTTTCTACKELLTRSRQGQEWLQFLAQPPVSSDLVAKILARTSGAAATGIAVAGPMPQAEVVPFWSRMGSPMRRAAEPRLMMTAAMAFFSVALTLNLAGVRLTAVHVADLRPSSLRANLTRQFINSKVGVENYCYNLKIVYEMEARVRELKRSADLEESAPAQQQQAPAAAPKGSAHKGGKSENLPNPEPRVQPRPARWGTIVEAGLDTRKIGSNGQDAVAVAHPEFKPRMEAELPSQLQSQPGNESGITPVSCVGPHTDRAEGSLA